MRLRHLRATLLASTGLVGVLAALPALYKLGQTSVA
jgi:hypothetical protein